MKRIILLFKIFFFFAVTLICVNSCKDFADSSSIGDEANKSPYGTWKITRVLRNGEDISNRMNFSEFRLNLHENGTYTYDNYLPFVFRNEGTWSIDNPQFPFNIEFTEGISGESVISGFDLPAVRGKRQLVIMFKAGCHLNTYTYSFIRDE